MKSPKLGLWTFSSTHLLSGLEQSRKTRCKRGCGSRDWQVRLLSTEGGRRRNKGYQSHHEARMMAAFSTCGCWGRGCEDACRNEATAEPFSVLRESPAEWGTEAQRQRGLQRGRQGRLPGGRKAGQGRWRQLGLDCSGSRAAPSRGLVRREPRGGGLGRSPESLRVPEGPRSASPPPLLCVSNSVVS